MLDAKCFCSPKPSVMAFPGNTASPRSRSGASPWVGEEGFRSRGATRTPATLQCSTLVLTHQPCAAMFLVRCGTLVPLARGLRSPLSLIARRFRTGVGPHEDRVVQYNSRSSSSSPRTRPRRIARDAVLKAGVCSAPVTSTLVVSIGTLRGTVQYRFSPRIARYLHSRLGSLLDKQRAASRTNTEVEHPAGGES
jgi:hypothetical protein